MGRFFHAIVLGLVGAGIVHIAVLLLVPSFSQRDAWALLSERNASSYTPIRLDDATGRPLIGSLDPLFRAVACRFDLADGVLRMEGDSNVPFWSVSVYDRSGQNVFSLNDRTASEGRLDFVVATPQQMIALRNDLPLAVDRSVFVEADIGEGIIVARAFMPDGSWAATVSAFLDSIRCEPH